MTVKEVPSKFETSDGQKFSTKAEAERYQRFLDAAREYEAAQQKLGIALAESTKTADGQLFDFSQWTYYRVACSPYLGANIDRVAVSRWDQVRIGNDRDHSPELLIDLHIGGKSSRLCVKIRDLYTNERNAKAALIKAFEQQIADATEALEQMMNEQP